MSFERKTSATTNNKYPTTQYGASKVGELASKGASIGGSGDKHTYELEYDIDVAEGTVNSDADPSVVTLPVGSVITKVEVFVKEDLAGGTDFSLGLIEPDGTAILADGLVADSTLDTAGDYVVGAGASLDTPLTEAAQLLLSGSRTAGKLLVRVRYITSMY